MRKIASKHSMYVVRLLRFVLLNCILYVDVYEDFVSPVTAAQCLLRSATEKRKQILDPVMNFCVQILNTPAETRDPRQKDGVLHMIGTLSDILLKVMDISEICKIHFHNFNIFKLGPT
jgi:hypothetical protein